MVKIFGCLWLVLALMICLKPQAIKNWFKNGKRKNILLLTFGLSLLLIYAGFRSQGTIGNVLIVFGGLGVIKAIVFLNAKLYSKMISWALGMPDMYFRIGGCIHIALAMMLLLLG